MTPEDAYSLSLLALCIYREARGEPFAAKRGVASVVRNRVQHPGWWGKSYASVISKRAQFSAMTIPGDPNLVVWPREDEPAWKDCLAIAAATILGNAPDNTNGATHYFAPKSLPFVPKWAQDPADSGKINEILVTVRIGAHVFMVLPA